MPLKPGDKASDFNLTDQSGSAVSPKDFEARQLLVYFYPQTLTFCHN